MFMPLSSPQADPVGSTGNKGTAPIDENVLTHEQQERLLLAAAHSGRGRRDLVIILLALKAGLHAREQCRLDVRHVAPVGAGLPGYILVPGRGGSFDPALPTEAVPIPWILRNEIEALIAWRRERCKHGDGRYGKQPGPHGIVLCHACRQPLDFGRTPFLQSRAGQRLSERQIHKVFAKLRASSGLNQRHTLGMLVDTYEVHRRELLTHAIQADR